LTVALYSLRPPWQQVFSWQGSAKAVTLSPAMKTAALDAVARNGVKIPDDQTMALVAAKEKEHSAE